jgi:arabinofuranosyltransferase
MRKYLRPEIIIPCLAIALRLISGPRTIDDAFITYRYAQNLLAGNGLVYNPHEFILGTTTPAYALLMAAAGLFAGGSSAPFPEISLVINAVADGVTCLLLIYLGARLQFPLAGIASALIWAVAPYSVTFAIGGMETSIFVLLMLATFYFHIAGRPVAAALVGSLCLLARPDAAIFLSLIILCRILTWARKDTPRPTYQEVIAFAAPVLLWLVASTLYYGSPLPHSIAAKVSAYRLPPEAALVRLLQHYGTPFLGDRLFGNAWIGIGLILYCSLFVLGSISILRKNANAWPVVLYPVFYLLVFALANPLIFRWYLTPPLPIFFLGIFAGVERISHDLNWRPIFYAFAVLAAALSLNGWSIRPDHGPRRPAPEMAYIELELLYTRVAEFLVPDLQPGDVLAAGDIGALGYYTRARILDTIGLISAQSLPYYPLPESSYVINYAIPKDLILDLEPDYLVTLEVYGRNDLLKDAAFLHAYTLKETFPTDIYGSDGMLVFEKTGD